MEKRIITNATLQVLLDSNLVFTKKTFARELNHLLSQHDLELHEKTIREIVKNLQGKDYIQIDDNKNIIKSKKTIINSNNKQRKLFETLVNEYKDSFDLDYIKQQYLKTVKSEEQTSAEHLQTTEASFDLLADETNLHKKLEQSHEHLF